MNNRKIRGKRLVFLILTILSGLYFVLGVIGLLLVFIKGRSFEGSREALQVMLIMLSISTPLMSLFLWLFLRKNDQSRGAILFRRILFGTITLLIAGIFIWVIFDDFASGSFRLLNALVPTIIVAVIIPVVRGVIAKRKRRGDEKRENPVI